MLPDKSNCCGCSACASICPTGAIELVEDDEGFLFPKIDDSKCIHCGSCGRVCPIRKEKNNSNIIKIYAGYLKDTGKLKDSASGGVATALYEYFLKNNGIVFGVRWSNNFEKANYVEINNVRDLTLLKSSKYIQSEKGNIFKIVKQRLDEDKLVLFVGLPCDIAGLKSYLINDYINLFTCSLVCMGPTSPKVAKEYIKYLEEKNKSIIKYFNLRDKVNGWGAPNYVRAIFENGNEYLKAFNETEFGKAFQYFGKSSCYNCQFKINNSKSDIIIGDYWGVDKKDKIYNKLGVSILIIHSKKMEEILKNINTLKLTNISYEDALKNNVNLIKSRSNKNREKYSSIFISKGLIAANKSTESLFKHVVKRTFLYKIYNNMKRSD